MLCENHNNLFLFLAVFSYKKKIKNRILTNYGSLWKTLSTDDGTATRQEYNMVSCCYCIIWFIDGVVLIVNSKM